MTDLAAIDLGSNSFHMLIARIENGELTVVDRIKEMVSLAGGLDDDNMLHGEVVERALLTLERFSERLRSLDPHNIRAVGTNTMRRAKNGSEFLARAEVALGHRIEVVSGDEEARLIYLGVAHSIEWNEDPRLVVDIGGGSTELIVGEQFNPWLRESKHMGCVAWSRLYFDDGRIDRERFLRAVRGARQEMLSSEKKFRASNFLVAIGASGTIRSVQTIVHENGWSNNVITKEAMDKLADVLIAHGDLDTIELLGLDPDRRPVLAGGFAILYAIFEALGLDQMTVSDGAMREGLLHDLLGRIEHRDVREETIATMMERYNVNIAHATSVEDTAISIYNQIKLSWDLTDQIHEQRLRWACRIHEIGLAISHSQHQKHGSYLVENSDMPGFSRQDQKALWALVRSHRRKFKPHRFDGLGVDQSSVTRIAIVLRLAAMLNRTRQGAPDVIATAGPDTLTLQLPTNYFEGNPLTRDDLETERSYLQNVQVDLEFNDR